MPRKTAEESRAYGGPGKYIQGPGEINNLHKWAAKYGEKALAVIDPYFFDNYSVLLKKQFEENGLSITSIPYYGHPCDKDFEEIMVEVGRVGYMPDAVIGIGGGRSTDMGKAVAAACKAASIVVPTAISCDAPCTTHSVFYSENNMPYSKIHRSNPDYVVVDTEITIKAPALLFQAGIGDALATYYEGHACLATGNVNNVCGGAYKPTRGGFALAETCKNILLKEGRAAYLAAKSHIRTLEYEDVAEANVMLSGMGFENTAVSIAHGIEIATNALQLDGPGPMHGIGVAYGVLIQLLVEQVNQEEFKTVYSFCDDLGLPVRLYDIGVKENEEEAATIIGDAAMNLWMIHNEPFTVTASMIRNAVLYLEEYSKVYQAEKR